ncbi:MAG: hypothetical protein RBT60_01900 [Candidatus Krumholzibacteria bacterium]|nr:hypothetical protein [Candidatus Krumholzibacteria bacterium]
MIRVLACVRSCLLAGIVFPLAASAAGPMFWDSPAKVPFGDGELQGAALDPDGSLVPGLAVTTMLADSNLVFWSAARSADGAVYVGSGHQGHVWRVDRRGQASLLADLPAEEVFSLLVDGTDVWAGCGPGGQVFVIDSRGQAVLRGTVPGGFVWDLERAADGTLFLATGNPAAVYRVGRGGGALSLVAELPADNALGLAIRDDGMLLVATQAPGRVFRVDPRSGAQDVLLAMEQDEGRQVLRGPDGWYALGCQAQPAQGGQGGGRELSLNPFDIMVTAEADIQQVRVALYRLDGAAPERVWSSEHGLTSVAWSDDHGWLAAGERENSGPARLYGLTVPNGRRVLAAWEGGDVLDLAVVGKNNDPDEVLAVQAHPGRLTRLAQAGKDDAVALGAPLDGRAPVRWGRLTWQGAAGGQEPRFAVRTGMTQRPDGTWSAWTELGRGRDLDLGKLPAARCLQWRVVLPAGSRLDAVTVSALAPNLAPQITLLELQPAGEMLRGGMMAASENVTQRFESGLQIEYSTQRCEDRRIDRERAAALRPLRTVSWHARDPNEDRLQYRVLYRREGQSVWLPLEGPLLDQVLTWDTATLADGYYELRLVASDRLDNPEPQALTAERILRRIPVDNTPPELTGWELRGHADGFALALRAGDAFGNLAGADVILPDGSIQRLDPVDGICDSAREEFAAVIAYPRAWSEAVARPWTVRVRVWDLQGNIAQVSGVLP